MRNIAAKWIRKYALPLALLGMAILAYAAYLVQRSHPPVTAHTEEELSSTRPTATNR